MSSSLSDYSSVIADRAESEFEGSAQEDSVETPAPTGRMRHEEKITVYFSSEELIALEDARLNLRRRHRLAVDRGRIVRAAVALALSDLAEHGETSKLYTHLSR